MKLSPDSTRRILFGVALVVLICGSAQAVETNDATRVLADHIADTHRLVIVDTNRAETAWSDGVMLEVATNFPTPVRQLISNPSRHQDIHPYIIQLEITNGSWKRAKITTANTNGLTTIVAADGAVKALVKSLYLDYARQRYTNATLWIKDPFDPVVVGNGRQVRIAIMPVHPELGGKPGAGIRAITVTNMSR